MPPSRSQRKTKKLNSLLLKSTTNLLLHFEPSSINLQQIRSPNSMEDAKERKQNEKTVMSSQQKTVVVSSQQPQSLTPQHPETQGEPPIMESPTKEAIRKACGRAPIGVLHCEQCPRDTYATQYKVHPEYDWIVTLYCMDSQNHPAWHVCTLCYKEQRKHMYQPAQLTRHNRKNHSGHNKKRRPGRPLRDGSTTKSTKI